MVGRHGTSRAGRRRRDCRRVNLPLVPVGDDEALSRALLDLLDLRPDPALLRQRAEEFSSDRAAAHYAQVLQIEGAHRAAPERRVAKASPS